MRTLLTPARYITHRGESLRVWYRPEYVPADLCGCHHPGDPGGHLLVCTSMGPFVVHPGDLRSTPVDPWRAPPRRVPPVVELGRRGRNIACTVIASWSLLILAGTGIWWWVR